MADTSSPHDALAKWTFSNPKEAESFIRSVLSQELIRHFDFNTLRLAPGSFVDKTLSGAHSDLLFKVQIADRPAFVYFLFEHLSTVDGLLPLRLLRYLVNILERHVEEAKDRAAALPLPLIIPVVLHHSDSGWTSPTRLGGLYDPRHVSNPSFHDFVPDFRFCLDDISHVSDEDLRRRSLGAASILTMWALRDARHPDRLLDTLQHFADLIQQLRADPGGRNAFAAVLRYILLVADIPANDIVQRLETLAPGTKEDIMTPAEQWRAEGETRGREKGRVEGRVEGRVTGRVEMLLRQLSVRFGPVSASVVERVRGASEEELMCWAERILTAGTLDAVFSE